MLIHSRNYKYIAEHQLGNKSFSKTTRKKVLMLEVLLTALLITVIFGIVMRMSPSLSARAKTLLLHPLARTIIFQAVLRLIRIFILRR